MFNDANNKKLHSSWLLAALVAPVTQTASNCSWPSVALVAVLCLVINYGMEKLHVERTTGRWVGAIQWLWMLLVISEFMHWVMYCWPIYENYHVVPLTLLLLAAYTVSKGTKTAARAGSALKVALLSLIGVILFAGIREVRLENLKPVWQMQTAHLITAMLIPVMGFRYGEWKGKRKVFEYALGVSVITAGVMSLAYVRRVDAPFYELSRGIRIFGTDLRLESLVAAGMTLGYYVLLSYLIGITADAWEPEKHRVRSIWISALFAGLVFISGMRLNSRLLAIGNLVIWSVIPILKNIGKNMKLVLDK